MVLHAGAHPNRALRGFPADIALDADAIELIPALPIMLELARDFSGLRFVAVARVTDQSWTPCAVLDDLQLGVTVGQQLDVQKTLCLEVKKASESLLIDHASADSRYCQHPATVLFQIESYISVPIVLTSGRYYGNLFALDHLPGCAARPGTLRLFQKLATLIAWELDSAFGRETVESALRNELAQSELRDQFIAILGHDLRNPLQAIFATGDLLERKLQGDAVLGAMAGRIKTNVHRMSSLINDVLDFARGRLGGGITLRIDAADTLDIRLAAVITECMDAHPHRHIDSRINVNCPVPCDVARVQQVASNLLGNALTHGAPHSPVKVVAYTDATDFVLQVWNDGDPIPEPSLAKIFEPFWRNSTVATREGLGLGLHICAQIVKAHGGQLQVRSTRESGTTFTVRLPLQMSPLSRPADQGEAPNPT